MNNFCTKCGKRLIDDQKCSCKETYTNQFNNFNVSNLKSATLESKNFFIDFFRNPNKFITNPTSIKPISAIIILVLKAIIFSLIILISLDQAIGMISTITFGLGKGISNEISEEINYFSYFFLIIFFNLVQSALLISAFFLISKILKYSFNFQSALSIISISSIPFVALQILTIIFIFISPTICFLLLLLGIITFLSLATKCIDNINAPQTILSVYFVPFAYIVYLIFIYIFLRIVA